MQFPVFNIEETAILNTNMRWSHSLAVIGKVNYYIIYLSIYLSIIIYFISLFISFFLQSNLAKVGNCAADSLSYKASSGNHKLHFCKL